MAEKFLAKYFPPAKSIQLKIEISTFRQMDTEHLYEAWERYKELLRHCPNHNFANWEQIEWFYNGLNAPTRMNVDSTTGGTIFAKDHVQAYDMLEQMTINSFHWPSERTGVKKPVGVYAVDPLTSITTQLSALTTQVASLNKINVADSTGVEGSHTPEQVNYINPNGYRGYGAYRGNHVPNTFHPNLRNNENFSYSNNTNKGDGKLSLEDVVSTLVQESGKRIARTKSRLDILETHVVNMGSMMKSMETSIG
ncbi:uncharacterized protein [Henckelia pumila]|uniref:uncharacterized protein n=1 Tax=Henckelia pumila TaxID=405737 RepID=UPI003C6E2A00